VLGFQFTYNDRGIRVCTYCYNTLFTGQKSIEYGADFICESCFKLMVDVGRKFGMLGEPVSELPKYLVCNVEGCGERFDNHGSFMAHRKQHKRGASV